MKYRIRYLPDTIDDRLKIKNYLSRYYTGTAKRFFNLLKKKISKLRDFPYSCQVYEDDTDYRRLVVRDYLVFYMINEDKKTVDIHRIFHGSQDIDSQLH